MPVSKKTWFWVGVVLAIGWFTWSGDGNPVDGVADLINSIERGSRLTRAPYDPDTGVVPGKPEDLASTAGLTEDQYSLARMISSEEGNSSNLIKAAVCWATINYAQKAGKTVSDLLLNAVDHNHSGSYGTFKNIDASSASYKANAAGKAIAADRYASTALDPYAGDGEIASDVLDGTIPDPTNGAQQFDRPAGESDPDRVATKREAAGAQVVAVDGIDSAVLRFWKT